MVAFDPTITISSIFLGIGLLITAATLFLNFIQLRRSWRVQKAQFLANITNDLFDDTDLRKFFYSIDYEKFTFSEIELDEFKGSDQERHLDALLYRYNLLGRLVRMNVLKKSELEFLFFEMIQVFKNPEVSKYIHWLEQEYSLYGSIGNNRRKRPYDDARWLIEELTMHDSISEMKNLHK